MNKNIVTHSGNFHADDVFAVATLLIVFPDAKVIRTRDASLIENADVVADVGGIYDPNRLRFDHHQIEGAGSHYNGIPYASFGLVWKKYGEKISGSTEVAKIIEKNIVIPIDAHDNEISINKSTFDEIKPYTFSDFLNSFVDRNTVESEVLDEIFIKLTTLTKDLILREVKKANEKIIGINKIKKIIDLTEDKKILLLEEDLPWEDCVASVKDVVYVIYPRKDGNWGLKGVRKNFDDFDLRKPLPNSWAGLGSEELKSITGVKDAIFCHKGLFMAVSKTKEGALELAKIAISA